jgi:hypothetical protein
VEESKLEMAGQYRIRVRRDNWEVEVSAPEKDFVLNESDRLIEQFSLSTKTAYGHEAEKTQQEGVVAYIESGLSRNVKPQTLNEFFRQFKFQTNLEKTLVLGYWCEVKLGHPHFTSDDILARYKEAKEPAPANIRRDLSNLVGKGFLLSSGKSEDGVLAYELTNSGINEVESKIPRA